MTLCGPQLPSKPQCPSQKHQQRVGLLEGYFRENDMGSLLAILKALFKVDLTDGKDQYLVLAESGLEGQPFKGRNSPVVESWRLSPRAGRVIGGKTTGEIPFPGGVGGADEGEEMIIGRRRKQR
jgi:hypothetical protein